MLWYSGTILHSPDLLHRFKVLHQLHLPLGQGAPGCHQREISGQAALPFVLVFALFSPASLDHGGKNCIPK